MDTTFITDKGEFVKSLNGAIAAHDFYDHATGLVRTYCVASKGNWLVVLQTAIRDMYTQYGRRLHVVDTDNAPEFGRGLTGDFHTTSPS